MIKSFRCADTEALFNRRTSVRFQSFAKIGYRKLVVLHAATSLKDLTTPPGNELERLEKDEGTTQHQSQQTVASLLCLERPRRLQRRNQDYH
jgi:toxin HigB-1